MNARAIPALAVAVCLLFVGCHTSDTSSSPHPPAATPQDEAAAANQLFLNQKTFDPWVLSTNNPDRVIDVYISDGKRGTVLGPTVKTRHAFMSGNYKSGQLEDIAYKDVGGQEQVDSDTNVYVQGLDIGKGLLQTQYDHDGKPFVGVKSQAGSQKKWEKIWQTSDIVITGDPEAQQVTHANLFYLLSSTYPGSDHSIPPMGLSSNIYGGHIFWDADVWMLPALLVQHPDYAKSIVDYRFKTLGQAKKNATMHHFAGAEYAWESADTGAEMVSAEFAKERHITADVGWATWQYYLWTGDKKYLAKEGWPILQATAAYWVSRVTKGADGKWHIKEVLSPDETAGVVDDDAWTNAVVQANLRAATSAAQSMGQAADPRWKAIADALYFPYDKARGIPAENARPLTDHFAAKQADTLLLIHPLNVTYDALTAGKMLDFYAAHTIQTGPAMTASIEAVVAARLGRGQQSLDLFHDSYRPFMRGPWDAFAEKRTSSRVYFCTGMGGCLQSVLYGFAGLQVVAAGDKGRGTKLASDGEAALYADPHLPPGWGGLTIKGVKFRGRIFDVAMTPGNTVTATPR